MSRKGWTADMHKDLAADLYGIRNAIRKALKHPLRATEGDRLVKTLNQIDALRSTLENRALKEGHEEAAKHYYARSGLVTPHPDEKEDREDNTTQEILDEEARQEVLDDEAREIEQDIINEEEGE